MHTNHIPIKFATGLTILRDIVDGKNIIVPAGQKLTSELLHQIPKLLQSNIIVVKPQLNLNQIVKDNIANYEKEATKQVIKIGKQIPAGTVLFEAGENTHTAFLLLNGEIEIKINNRIIATINKEGSFIGEMAAIRSKPRSATAIAKTDCMVHSFDGKSLIGQAKTQPLVMVRLCRNLAMKLHEINQKISEESTSTVSEQDITQAFDKTNDSQSGMTKTYPAGKTLFKQGETSLDLYILLDGKLNIEVDGRHVASLGERGSIIGEMSSLLSQPRSATVRTETACTLASICITKLEQFTSFMPGLLEKIAISLAERIAQTNTDYIRLVN